MKIKCVGEVLLNEGVQDNGVDLRFENVGLSDENRGMIEAITDITEKSRDVEVNRFRKGDIILFRGRIQKLNTVPKEIKTDNITGTVKTI